MLRIRQAGYRARPGRLAASPGFTLIELLVVIVVIGVLAALALPNYVRIKEKAKEAEVKAAVHKIQTDLERFAVDSEGSYPPYLIGGDNAVLPTNVYATAGFVGSPVDTPLELARDPLLRGGYLDSYPTDPFLRNEPAVRQFQADVGDPLRNGAREGLDGGTRFGPYGNLLGQCLCDARWLQWTHIDPVTGVTQQRFTWSNIQYEFYDVWAGNKSRPYLPGAFMYKSCGPLVPNVRDQKSRDYAKLNGADIMLPRGERDDVTYPIAIDNYILGAWGGTRTKGLDILGEEPLVVFTLQTSKPGSFAGNFWADPGTLGPAPLQYTPGSDDGVKQLSLMGIAPWTRGVNRAHVGPLWGSPYGPAPTEAEQLTNSNPNGLRDGLIISLNGGDQD